MRSKLYRAIKHATDLLEELRELVEDLEGTRIERPMPEKKARKSQKESNPPVLLETRKQTPSRGEQEEESGESLFVENRTMTYLNVPENDDEEEE